MSPPLTTLTVWQPHAQSWADYGQDIPEPVLDFFARIVSSAAMRNEIMALAVRHGVDRVIISSAYDGDSLDDIVKILIYYTKIDFVPGVPQGAVFEQGVRHAMAVPEPFDTPYGPQPLVRLSEVWPIVPSLEAWAQRAKARHRKFVYAIR